MAQPSVSPIDESAFSWSVDASGRLNPNLMQSPDPGKNLLAGVLSIVQQINKHLCDNTDCNSFYFKGNVASGKTTTLKILHYFSQNCLFFNSSPHHSESDNNLLDEELLVQMKTKWNGVPANATLREALTAHLPENAVIFIDEAHIAFRLGTRLLSYAKEGGLRCRIIYVSTTNPGRPEGHTGPPTPEALVSSTFIIDWSMNFAVATEVVKAHWAPSNPRDATALAKFLLAVAGGHRGICVELLTAVTRGSSLNDAVGKMNTLFCQSDGLQCRGAHSNGYFDDALKLPGVGEIIASLMTEGFVQYTSTIDTIRHLITIGCLTSTQSHLKDGTPLTAPNPFYARSILRHKSLHRSVENPVSIYDYLAYGITNFKLESLFNSAERTTTWYTRGDDPTPYELQIDEGITSGIEESTRMTAQKGFSSKKGIIEGKPDAVFGSTHAIEYVIYGNDVIGHFNRFDLFPAYHQQNQLLVVFASRDADVSLPTQRCKSTRFLPANIVIVRFHKSTVWSFQLEICEATELPKTSHVPVTHNGQPQIDASGTPFQYTHDLTWTKFTGPDLPVDFVARHVILDKIDKSFQFKSAQTVTCTVLASADTQVGAKRKRGEGEAIYVNVSLPDGTSVATDVYNTLDDNNIPLTVDGLKEAVLKKCPHKLKDKDISDLTVYPPGATKGDTAYGTGSAVGDVDTPLKNAPLKEPYWVEVK